MTGAPTQVTPARGLSALASSTSRRTRRAYSASQPGRPKATLTPSGGVMVWLSLAAIICRRYRDGSLRTGGAFPLPSRRSRAGPGRPRPCLGGKCRARPSGQKRAQGVGQKDGERSPATSTEAAESQAGARAASGGDGDRRGLRRGGRGLGLARLAASRVRARAGAGLRSRPRRETRVRSLRLRGARRGAGISPAIPRWVGRTASRPASGWVAVASTAERGKRPPAGARRDDPPAVGARSGDRDRLATTLFEAATRRPYPYYSHREKRIFFSILILACGSPAELQQWRQSCNSRIAGTASMSRFREPSPKVRPGTYSPD